jgi:hypothetical protein
MALTDLEKAQNKAANTVRDRAHRARRKQLSEAEGGIESDPQVLQAYKVREDANAAMEAALAQRDEKVRALRAKIADLQAQIEILRDDPAVRSTSSRERAAATSWRAIRDSKSKEVEQKFPDLQGHARWSAASWEPPQDVKDAMEAARRSATVDTAGKKKAERSKA